MEVEPKKWRRWLFYLDIVVVAVMIISIVMLAKDAYTAGYYHGNSNEITYLWQMGRDIAFVTGSLAWIFYRFFTNEFRILRHPW